MHPDDLRVSNKLYRPRKFKQYRLPNARIPPGGGITYVQMGDLILFKTVYKDDSHSEGLGRVLDQATRNGMGEPLSKHFRVLVPADDMHFAYIRIIDILDIVDARRPPFDFAQFFFRSELPSPEIINAMSNYGSLNDSYIAKDLERRGVK